MIHLSKATAWSLNNQQKLFGNMFLELTRLNTIECIKQCMKFLIKMSKTSSHVTGTADTQHILSLFIILILIYHNHY